MIKYLWDSQNSLPIVPKVIFQNLEFRKSQVFSMPLASQKKTRAERDNTTKKEKIRRSSQSGAHLSVYPEATGVGVEEKRNKQTLSVACSLSREQSTRLMYQLALDHRQKQRTHLPSRSTHKHQQGCHETETA